MTDIVDTAVKAGSLSNVTLSDLKDLCNYAWLILGVEAIVLYFAQEEICRTEICNIDQTPIC